MKLLNAASSLSMASTHDDRPSQFRAVRIVLHRLMKPRTVPSPLSLFPGDACLSTVHLALGLCLMSDSQPWRHRLSSTLSSYIFSGKLFYVTPSICCGCLRHNR